MKISGAVTLDGHVFPALSFFPSLSLSIFLFLLSLGIHPFPHFQPPNKTIKQAEKNTTPLNFYYPFFWLFLTS